MITRTFKRLIARVAIAAVLFTQLAVAAYACPALTGELGSAPVAVASNQHAGMTGGCQEVDADNSNICQQHCLAGNQSVQAAPHLNIPPVAMMSIGVVDLGQPASALGVTVLPVLLERITAPPPSIRFRVFRI